MYTACLQIQIHYETQISCHFSFHQHIQQGGTQTHLHRTSAKLNHSVQQSHWNTYWSSNETASYTALSTALSTASYTASYTALIHSTQQSSHTQLSYTARHSSQLSHVPQHHYELLHGISQNSTTRSYTDSTNESELLQLT